jgi:hypothetical protein
VENKPPAAGRGRPKGSPNKIQAAVKEMVIQALNEAHADGGVAYLKEQASKNPTAFLSLVGKVLPLQVQGDPNAPLVHKIVREFVGPPHPNG